MADKPNLPLDDIKAADKGALKKTEVADKSGVSGQDIFLATVSKGSAGSNLKKTETQEKKWTPTADEFKQKETE